MARKKYICPDLMPEACFYLTPSLSDKPEQALSKLERGK
jgi:hypothetical protein